MTERAADQSATPTDIATLYSRATVQGIKYWDFSASRKQVRGQFCDPMARERAERMQPQVVREQAIATAPQVVQEPADLPEPQMMREQAIPAAPQVVPEPADPPEPQMVREQAIAAEPQVVSEPADPPEPQMVREQAIAAEPQVVSEPADLSGPQEAGEQSEPGEAQIQPDRAEPAEPQEAFPQSQLEDAVLVPQFEPGVASEEVLMLEPEPPSEIREMTPSEAAQPQTSAGPILQAGSKLRREESGPGPLVQWPAPRPQPSDEASSRWYALQSVFDPPEEAVEAPSTSLEQRPPMVLVFSLAGGVGKTCLVATLGRALSALGERVLLADTAAYGLLPFYFGSREFKPEGGSKRSVRTFSPPSSESAAPVHVLNLEADRYSGEGGKHDPLLGKLVHDGRGVNRILVDVATASRDVTSRLLFLNPTVVVPVLPDMSSVASLGSLEAFLAGADRGDSEPHYLLNQFDASLPLHLDVREILREQLGDRLLPFVLRRSAAVSEALAEGMTVIDYAPGSAAAKDYWDLAGWLRSLDVPAAIGFGGLRWSER
jgi:cellulose synthase operon protein YhjQ